MHVSHVSLGGLFAVAAVTLIGASPVFAATSAAQSVTKACSQQYQAAKSAGTLPAGEKWTQFLSECSAKMKSSAASPTTGSTAAMGQSQGGSMGQSQGGSAGQTSGGAPMKPMASTQAAGTPKHMTVKQICNQQYQQAKAAGTLGGKRKAVFLSDCAAGVVNDKEDASTPDEPQATTANVQVPTVDKNGKPLSPGEIAFRQRIKECSMEWQHDKSAGTLPAGEKWPQFWSACNKNLKAQG